MASASSTSTPVSTGAAGPSRTTVGRKDAGPLPTAFEAPSRCFDRTLDSAVFDTLDQGGYEYAQDLSMFVTDFKSAHSLCPDASFVPCLPSHGRQSSVRGRAVFFSPGLECPRSWRTVASATTPSSSSGYLYVNGIVVSTLLPDESAYVCCPDGFDYIVNMPPVPPVAYCTSAVERFDSRHRQWSCSGNATLQEMTGSDAGYVITLTSTVSGRPSQVPVSFMTVKLYAPTIQINRRPQDVPASPTTATTATATGARNEGARGPVQDRATVIHGGAVAGIAVGVVGLVALLGVAIACIWSRRRRRHETAMELAGRHKPELDGTARPDPRHGRSELEAGERHELDGGTGHQIFELHESHRGAGEEGHGTAKADEARARRYSGRLLGR